MELATLIGWAAATTGAIVGIPQAWHIWRTRDVEGVSLWTWQTILAINIAWGGHGLRLMAPNLIAVNIIGLAVTMTILVLMSRALGCNLFRVMLPGLLIGAAMVAIDVAFGSLAFGLAAIIPGTWGLITQGRELLRAPSVHGVSGPFLIILAINFALWLTWGVLVADPAAAIANGVALTVGAFNAVWYLARRYAGVRPIGTPAAPAASMERQGINRGS